MTDPRLILQLYGNDEPPAQPIDLIGASDQLPELPWQQQEQLMPAPKNIAQRLQEMLGAKEPDPGGVASDILSARFGGGASYGDYAQGIKSSALGKPAVGSEFTDQRMAGMMRQMESIANLERIQAQTKLTQSGGPGNATIKAAQAIMTENPGMTFSEAFSFAKSGLGQGVTYGPNGVATMQGAPQAAGAMAYGRESGQRTAELETAGSIGFAKDRGQAAGKASIDNTKSSMDLNNLDYSIAQAKALVPKVALTGPILGRVGNAANDPNYANLQGALNGITLQAKELYNLGSGQGFSDADRQFLTEVIAGKYSRSETINLALDRMLSLSAKRNQFLNQQNKRFGSEFGYGAPQFQQPNISASDPAGGIKFLGFE